jgi:hypothetical protein
MVKQQSNHIAWVTLILFDFLYTSVLKTIWDFYENYPPLRITKSRCGSLIIAGSPLSAASMMVSKINQLTLKYQHASLSPNYSLDPLVQMTPNPGD